MLLILQKGAAMSASARRKIVEQYQTIEQLTARVRELEEENTRLHEQVDLQIPAIAFKQLTEQLAASQLHAEQLREALETLNKVSNIGCDRVEKALALPRDASALDAYVAEKAEEAYLNAQRAHAQFEATLTRQRDLAVEALRKANEGIKAELSDNWTCSSYHPKLFAGEKAIDEALSTIKESEAMAKGEQG